MSNVNVNRTKTSRSRTQERWSNLFLQVDRILNLQSQELYKHDLFPRRTFTIVSCLGSNVNVNRTKTSRSRTQERWSNLFLQVDRILNLQSQELYKHDLFPRRALTIVSCLMSRAINVNVDRATNTIFTRTPHPFQSSYSPYSAATCWGCGH
jgi:3-methyladenine DNA glycosylase/8-oxoguanine DNA glycosylase